MKKAKIKLDKTWIIGLLAIVFVLIIGVTYILVSNDIPSTSSKNLQTTKVSSNPKKELPLANDNGEKHHLLINVDSNIKKVTPANVDSLVNKNNTDMKTLNCYQFGVCVLDFISNNVHNPNYLKLWKTALKTKQVEVSLVTDANNVPAFVNKGTIYKVKVNNDEVYYSLNKKNNVHYFDSSDRASLIEIGSIKLRQILLAVNQPQNQSKVKQVIKYVDVK